MFSEDASLLGLFISSFLAATLLPGGSEVVLFGVLKMHPQLLWPALAIATLGNTLGGMTSYLLGRWLPDKPLKYKTLMQRFGNPALLLAWVPIIGDGLCVVAGWLRLNPLWAAFYMGAGKFLRYWVIASIT